MRKLFSYAVVAVLTVSSCMLSSSCRRSPPGWTEENQKTFRNKLYSVADTLLANDKDKNAFADCGLEKAKLLLPDGLKGVPDDSLNAISFRIGKSCMLELKPTVNLWNPQIEQAIKAKLMQYPAVHKLKSGIREAFCDCYLATVKKLYPNGVTSALPVQQQNEIAVGCLQKLTVQKK